MYAHAMFCKNLKYKTHHQFHIYFYIYVYWTWSLFFRIYYLNKDVNFVIMMY